nr:hypothetical protein [Candidatus Sigynarchaeota archaeon]
MFRIIAFCAIIGIATATIFGTIYYLQLDQLPNDNNPPNIEPPAYEKLYLDRFILDLNALFDLDNLSVYQTRMDAIGNASSSSMAQVIFPYPHYFHSGHYPGVYMWYLQANNRHIPISLPMDSWLVVTGGQNSTSAYNTNINGSTIIIDVHVSLYLNYYIQVHLGHACINKTLLEQWEHASPSLLFNSSLNVTAIYLPANTTFGFTNTYGVDFQIIDTGQQEGAGMHKYSPNPWFYFTQDARDQIWMRYQGQYERMKQSGQYIRSRLNHTGDLNVNGSIWGHWFYYQGGDFVLNESHHQPWWYAFEGSILTIMNLNQTDHESFWRTNAGNFTSDFVGVFGEHPANNVASHEILGTRYMYYSEGNNNTSGIFKLEHWWDGETVDTKYMKYQFQENATYAVDDDWLTIQYFDTLLEAQGDFTLLNATYTRWPQFQ